MRITNKRVLVFITNRGFISWYYKTIFCIKNCATINSLLYDLQVGKK
jgi:hypothetical protein